MNVSALCFLLLLGSVSCKRKDGKRKSDTEKYKTLPNVCDNENRESPLMCNCDQSDTNTATSAKCWVLSFPADIDGFSWSYFASQVNLIDLKISVRSGSQLTEMPTEMFQNLRKLETLEIQYGNIYEIRGYAFANASNLREAILSRNEIFMLHTNAFAYLLNLDSVSLEDNKIMELQPMVFHHVPNLRKLFLARNNLTIVHDNAFRFLNHLHELELNTNFISIITRETFNGLFHLRRLDLTANLLTMLGDFTFAELSELQELELERNSLEYISDRAFAGLPHLNRLRLAENKLKSLSDHLFEQNLNIQFLDLRDNKMEQLKLTTLKPLWDNFKNLSTHLLLEGNLFSCDCHLSWAYSLRDETPNKQVRGVLEGLTCVIGDELATDTLQLTEDEPLTNREQQDQFTANSMEYEDSVEYEDLPEDEGPPTRRIFDIPQELLPCPETLKAAAEEPKNSEEMPALIGGSGAAQLIPIVSLCATKTAFALFLT